MENNFSKRDLGYTIISRFETSFRNHLCKKINILFSDYKESIPVGIIEKIKEKNKDCIINDIYEFIEEIDFPDLKEISIYKGLYRYYFDEGILSKDRFIELMDDLYPIRCKIAHSRSTFTSIDIGDIFEKTREISNSMYDFEDEFLKFLTEIEDNPSKFIKSVPDSFSCFIKDQIPNNVPIPDYESEGGFVGRKDDIKKILKIIDGDIHRIVTITGAGGVGKTAIALNIVSTILKRENCSFDGIIWTSAKENKLTAVGIEDIEPTLKNYEELLDTILDVMGYGVTESNIEQKEKDVETIFDIHNNLLIVIDNLETITDDRIIDFILDAHKNLKILITSRRGLGQVERRYELNQLKTNEAISLFRQIASEKNLHSLSRLSDVTIKSYVEKIACYPLAIKWVIGNVALGKDINSIADVAVNEKSEIAQFCFDEIFSSLNKISKDVLCTLSLYDYPVSAGILKYVSNLNQSDFEDSIKELVLVSLIIQQQEKDIDNKILTKFNLLELTRGYVREQLDKNLSLKSQIEERMRLVGDTVEEAERAKKQYKYSLHNYGAVTEEEKVASLLGTTAFQKYQLGRYSEAVESYKRAVEIAPRLPSIYRNWAIMESNEGHSIEANQLMEKAVALNPDDAQIWNVWGNLKRKEGKIQDALDCYLKAIKISPCDPMIQNALGQAYCRLGHFEKADNLFRAALKDESNFEFNKSYKHEIINLTSIADNLRRWAEYLSKDRNNNEALIKLKEAEGHCSKAYELDKSDTRTQDLHKKIIFQTGTTLKRNKEYYNSVEHFKKLFIKKPSRYKEAEYTIKSAKELIHIYKITGKFDKIKIIADNELIKLAKRTDLRIYNDIKNLLSDINIDNFSSGEIISVNPSKGFCIIGLQNDLDTTYFAHISSFLELITNFDDSLKGRHVRFVPIDNSSNGKKEAKNIIFS